MSSKMVLVLILSLMTGSVFAKERCHRAKGNISVSFTSQDCSSPYGMCTTGEVRGDHFLRGTTKYTVEQIGGVAGDPYGQATVSYRGVLTLTTKHGTLTITDLGIWDEVAGVISSQSPTLSGTGDFEGVHGLFFTNGTATQPGFSSAISGNICVPHERDLDDNN
jgi:hypothetical protein